MPKKPVVLNEGDLLAYHDGRKEVLHRVMFVNETQRTVTTQELNTDGPVFTLPSALVLAGLTSQAFGLYTRDGVSQ